MTIEATPVELVVTLRNVEPRERVVAYAIDRLDSVVRSLPKLRAPTVEVTDEGTKAAEQRYIVQVTLVANGTLVRVEDRGPDPLPTIDRVHDLLECRIRDWKGHVYFEKRQEGAIHKEAMEMERRMREQGVRMVIMDTATTTSRAIKFFESMGFGKPHYQVWMSKVLGRGRRTGKRKPELGSTRQI